MAADRDEDEDTPPPKSKSSKGPKKRFQERDDTDDEGDDDRPRKKQGARGAVPPASRRQDDDEDEPRSKRQADTDDETDDEDRPRKKRRVIEDDGPRVKSNDNIPILMLLAFIGSALALMVICGGCGWFSFDWLVLGGTGGGGWGGNEVEFTSVTRTQARPMDPPYLTWAGVTKQNTNTNDGRYYMVLKCGSQTVTRDFQPGSKGTKWSGSGPENGLRGSSGKLEVWIEKRPNPVANGKVVSNVFVVP